MKKNALFIAFLLTGFFGLTAAWSPTQPAPKTSDPAVSLAAYGKMMTVLRSPRCMNCHPSDDFPRQGNDAHVHLFNVQRGKDDHGLPAMRCNTCHQTENNAYSGVPGAPKWGLAPRSMAWQGLTDGGIGRVMLDRSRNGGKNLAELVHHLTQDSLVLWGWNPGANRALPPLDQPTFAKYVHEWADNGAILPKD